MLCEIKNCSKIPQPNRKLCQHHYRELIFIPTHALYDTWTKIKRNPKDMVYLPWWNDYYAFESDVIVRPSPKHQLTLINPNGNYEPKNVEWSLPLQNKAYNKKSVSSNNNSGAVGVSWSNRDNRWIAYITVQTKRIYLGRFVSKSAATRTRKMAEERFKGMI